ncbi:MAG: carboxypeptidase regulatory-like domain-containing protein, partial [Pyrinomonadaceae bacterium]
MGRDLPGGEFFIEASHRSPMKAVFISEYLRLDPVTSGGIALTTNPMEPSNQGGLPAKFGRACASSARSVARAAHRAVHSATFGCSFSAAILLTAPISLHAQSGTGSVTGRVSNAATGNYLENAELRIAGTDRVTYSTSGGRYVFSEVPAGPIKISSSYTGLDLLEQTVTAVAGESVTLDFNLTEAGGKDVIQLGEFVVSGAREGNARAIVDQRRALNIKNVISADAFGSVSEDNLGEFLKYMPGLSINYNENDARTVSVRGLPSKYSSVTIDGMPVASADFAIGTGREFQFEQVSLST